MRYIQTPRGLAKVYQKYLQGAFGYCPRSLCDKQKVLPVGLSDTLKTTRFKVFCPRCEEVYLPKFRNINIDGAYFGTSFPHIFLKHYPDAIILPPKIYLYEPKIYGFKIYKKRGSKAFVPAQGTVKYVEDSMNGIDKEKLNNDVKQQQKVKEQKPIVASTRQNYHMQSMQEKMEKLTVQDVEDDEAQVVHEKKPQLQQQ